MPTLLLLDGLSLAYRAFYALPTDLATPEGTITNAVYGFTSMLVKVLGDEQPDDIAVVFDAPGRTFRHDLDGDYKGNRKETPDIFVPQLPLIHEVVEALHIPTLQVARRRGRRRDRHTRDAGRGRRHRRGHRHRRPRQLSAGVRPARQGALQPPRRLRLRALRRGRHLRAHRRHAGAVPRVRRARAATRATTCPAFPASARRPRRSSSPPTATSRASSSTSTSSRPSSARTSATPASVCSSTGEMSRLRLDVRRSTSVPPTCSRARGTAKQVRVLFDQLAFRTLAAAPARGGRGGRPRPRAKSTTLDVEVDRRSATRPPSVARSRRPRARAEPYAIEAALGGRAGVAVAVRAIAVATRRRARRRTSTRRSSPTRRCATRSSRCSTPDGPPLVAHRAKELMHGLDVDIRSLRHDTAVMAYLLDPALGEVPARRPRAAVPVARGALARRRARHPRPRRRCSRSRQTGRRAVVVLQLGGRARRTRSTRASSPISTSGSSARSSACSRSMESTGIRIDREFLEDLSAELGQAVRGARAADLRRTPARSST